MIKPRKVPMRICVACRERIPKRELVRLVRTPAGEVVVDPTGKKAGRGAYICLRRECLRKALQGKRLEKSLECPLSSAVIAALTALVEEREQIHSQM